MREIPVIAGPTASGKTALAVEVALALRARGQAAEIVTADAFQVYRGMDIGTAKPTAVERRGVPHHLIDLVEPTERFTVADWLAAAERTIAEIEGRGAMPIVVGGTHLYIKALLDGMFDGPPADERLREALRALGREALRAELERVDPEAAMRIHPNDERRTIRALEVFRLTGTPISRQQTQWEDDPGAGSPLVGSPALRAGPTTSPNMKCTPSRSPWVNLDELEHTLQHHPESIVPAGFVPRDPYPEGMYGPVDDLIRTRRYLPHLTLPHATYFVSWHAKEGEVLRPEERDIVLRAMTYFDGERARVYAACVMSNHVHWLIRPFEPSRLADLVSSVKRYSAAEVHRTRGVTGSLWQPECFDRIVRHRRDFVECVAYIALNPVEAGVSSRMALYPWTRVHVEAMVEQQAPGTECRATQRRATQRQRFRFGALQWPIEALNRRINARVRAMMECGLLEETRALWQAGRLGPQAREALGYKQLVDHLEGRCTLDEAVERIKVETRRFGKNQRTWIRRLGLRPGAAIIDAASTPIEAQIAHVLRD
ncbi:MAG: hypothetical protein HBSAPP03_07600 [Phycisphaerae bacterium]|nr:MAG: hypothetical protein HBSAPP03_07600 [Phycisphaerae bacterium]